MNKSDNIKKALIIWIFMVFVIVIIVEFADMQIYWEICIEASLALFSSIFVIVLFNKLKTNNIVVDTNIGQQTLNMSKKMTNSFNKINSEILRDIKHDIKTSLTVISSDVQNVAESLNYEIDKTDMQKCLSHAQNEVIWISKLIDRTMIYSPSINPDDKAEPLDLAIILTKWIKAQKITVQRNNNSLIQNIPDTLPSIIGNSFMLVRVLNNLISNANRYTHFGEIIVHAEIIKNYISICIKDNGSGIKPEDMEGIFERKPISADTGIGLSICKRIVEAHNGQIWIESEYGQGTRVTFILPIFMEGRVQ